MYISIDAKDFERHNPLMEIIRIPLLLLLDILPARISHRLFIKWARNARRVSFLAKTYRALEIIYTFPEKREAKEVVLGDVFWDSLLKNSRAVRNRLRLTEQLLKGSIIERSAEVKPVRILSLGSGSGRSIFEVMAALNGKVSVEATLVDKSRSAIKFSQDLSKRIVRNGERDRFRWLCTKTINFPDFFTGSSIDIVEMVGLLDYFDDAEAIKVFKLIYRYLSPNGWFVVSNIRPNLEKPFITKGVKWPLIYRTSEQLKKLLTESGFDEKRISVFVEPLKIYTVMLCQKV